MLILHFIVMLSVIVLNVIIQSVVNLTVQFYIVTLNVLIMNAILLNVVLPNAILVSVSVPLSCACSFLVECQGYSQASSKNSFHFESPQDFCCVPQTALLRQNNLPPIKNEEMNDLRKLQLMFNF
jgi:hypothetical protein